MKTKEITAKFEEVLQALPKITKFYDGDGEEVIAYHCEFCENYHDRFYDGMSEDEKVFLNDEISDHMRGCNTTSCSECNGYTFKEYVDLKAVEKALADLEKVLA